VMQPATGACPADGCPLRHLPGQWGAHSNAETAVSTVARTTAGDAAASITR
jgi:hypothetical protein